MPAWALRIGDPGDPTILVRDERDGRLISPFQHEHPFMVETNAEAGINRITEQNQVLQPNAGVYLLIYYVVTTNTHKLNLVVSFDIPEGIQCGHWDESSSRVLSHPAFQPFDWPAMTESSPPYVDIKVKVGGMILLHVILKSFRSRTDMTIQKLWVDESVLASANHNTLRDVQVQHAIFAGYDVCSHTFEAGQRVYTLGPNGTIVALSLPRAHVEVRKVLWNSVDFHGHEPDRFEYKFYDVTNAMSVATNRLAVPPSWIVLSNISGPACATIIQEARNAGAVAQAPDQVMQFGQIAAVHSPWFPGSTCNYNEVAPPPKVHTIRMRGDPAHNKHVIVQGSLQFVSRSVVAGDALALGGHDPNMQAPAIVIAPAMGMGITVLAAPLAAEDADAAVGLPPLIQISAPQHQPDMARGFVIPMRDNDGQTPFQVPAPLAEQTALQVAGSVRPLTAEAFSEPFFGRTIEERRGRPAVPKGPGPLRPVDVVIHELSAPTTLQDLLQRNMATVQARMPQLMGYGQALELPPEQAGSLLQLRAQLAAIDERILEQDQYRISCGRQVERMRDLVFTAPDRDETDQYVAHLGDLLVRDELILSQALEDTEKLHRVQAELNERADAALEAAGIGPAR
jgi:hypothetical protein